jgi:hypothetical protein
VHSDKERIYKEGQKAGSKGGFWEDVFAPYGSKPFYDGYKHAEKQRYSGGGGVGGGGGAGGLGVLVIPLLIVLLIVGAYSNYKDKKEAISALPRLPIAVAISDDNGNPTPVVRDTHGVPQTLRVTTSWNGQLGLTDRPMRIVILRQGTVVYDGSFASQYLSSQRLDAEVTQSLPAGSYVVRAMVEGAPSAEYAFTVRPKQPGDIWVSDRLFNRAPVHPIRALEHRPGEITKIYFGVSVKGALPANGKKVYIALLHNGEYLFNYSYPVNDQNRDFVVTHEADFAPGPYIARLSADGDPPAEYSFAVRNLIQETQEEKNRLVAGYMNSVFPGSSGPPLVMGLLRTCASASGWKDFVPKARFVAGETVCVYAEALYVNQGGRIDVSFKFRILDQQGQPLASRDQQVVTNSTDGSCWAFQNLSLPQESGPGSYTVAVEATDNLSGRVGSATVAFAVVPTDAPES